MLYRPQCGSYTVHPSHVFDNHGWQTSCAGLDRRDHAALELIQALEDTVRTLRGLTDPPALKLECHPIVPLSIMKVFTPANQSRLELGIGPDKLFDIPVEVVPDRPFGEWRLVIAEGRIPA